MGVVLTLGVVSTEGMAVFLESDDFDLVISEKPIFLYLKEYIVCLHDVELFLYHILVFCFVLMNIVFTVYTNFSCFIENSK